jgi:hypothetical protein
VEADGKLTNLNIGWLQSGIMGWPYSARDDLDNIYLEVGFGNGSGPFTPDHKTLPQDHFDPNLLFVEIETLHFKKIKHPLILKLFSPSATATSETMGGLADIPAWRKSASIYAWWPDLKRFAGNNKTLGFQLSAIVLRGDEFQHDPLNNGILDVSVMPAVIEHFYATETMLKVAAAQKAEKCIKVIEREPPPDDINDLSEI